MTTGLKDFDLRAEPYLLHNDHHAQHTFYFSRAGGCTYRNHGTRICRSYPRPCYAIGQSWQLGEALLAFALDSTINEGCKRFKHPSHRRRHYYRLISMRIQLMDSLRPLQPSNSHHYLVALPLNICRRCIHYMLHKSPPLSGSKKPRRWL